MPVQENGQVSVLSADQANHCHQIRNERVHGHVQWLSARKAEARQVDQIDIDFLLNQAHGHLAVMPISNLFIMDRRVESVQNDQVGNRRGGAEITIVSSEEEFTLVSAGGYKFHFDFEIVLIGDHFFAVGFEVHPWLTHF